MIEAYKPKRLAFYSLLALFVLLFFESNLAAIFPPVLLFMAIHGWESYYRADLQRIFGKADYGPDDKLSLLRVSCLLATLAVAAAFYFGLALWYIPLTFLGFGGAWLSHRIQFISDLLLSLTFPLALMAHSTEALALAPLYWFVFFQELCLRSAFQLTRPFGLENLNLTQIFGGETASLFVAALGCIAALWPTLMARYTIGLTFILFSFSGMLLAAAIYAVVVTHLARAQKLLRASSYVFLAALYFYLAGLRF